MNPLLVEVPEKVETERLLIAVPTAGIGPALSVAVAESIGQLSPWLAWAQQAPSFEDSEVVVRGQIADFVLRKDLRYHLYDRSPAGRRLLGGIGLLRIDWAVRRFEIGYWLRSSAQGQGYVTEAVQAMTSMAFDHLNARRVEMRIYEVNAKSRAVAERCGFELEGTLRNNALTPEGQLASTCVYARLG